MRITISVGGRFHAFNLAQQLFKNGFLEKLITSYPKFEVKKYGIPRKKTDTVVIKEILQRAWEKAPGFLQKFYNPEHAFHSLFDRISASKLNEENDIVVGSPEIFRHTLAKAKQSGAVTMLECGSSHELFSQKILKEEHDKFGIRPALYQVSQRQCIEDALNAYENADYISIPSLFVRQSFLDNGIPEKRLIHVPYGVDVSEFRQIPKEDNLFRVVFAGGMCLRKGVHYLLQAFSELDLPRSELLLIGSLDDEMKPFFKKYEGTFRWIGPVRQKDLHKYYSQGSVFVLNSIEDGFGMVINQAMACGLPVICTTNTGGPDIVREGQDGFVIPIRDVKTLKEKLVYLYENPEVCRQMGQSAKERVSSSFTWDDYGNRIIREYDRILHKSSASG